LLVLLVSLLATLTASLLLVNLMAIPGAALLVLLLSLLDRPSRTLPLDPSLGTVHLFRLRVAGSVLPERLGNTVEHDVVSFQLAIHFSHIVKQYKAFESQRFTK